MDNYPAPFKTTRLASYLQVSRQPTGLLNKSIYFYCAGKRNPQKVKPVETWHGSVTWKRGMIRMRTFPLVLDNRFPGDLLFFFFQLFSVTELNATRFEDWEEQRLSRAVAEHSRYGKIG
jgi:hypothetical protein